MNLLCVFFELHFVFISPSCPLHYHGVTLNRKQKLITMKTKNQLFGMIVVFISAISFGLLSCSNDENINGEGQIKMNITDAPIDEEGVTGVYITFLGIEYQKEGGPWQTAEEFEGPVTINLLELQNGRTELLGDFTAGAGRYTGVRFKLDAATRGSTASNPGCYITFEDGTQVPLFVPSGEQTGYKAVGEFTVPVNGTVEITADFDLRKSVTKAGVTGMYLLKPTIRVIVNNEAGDIRGNISNRNAESAYVVYAYEAGSYDESESDDPEGEEVRFPNAISSTGAEDNGDYILAFLAPKSYDLIVAEIDAEGAPTVVQIVTDVTVDSRQVTIANIEL